jgi:hypothetical protein
MACMRPFFRVFAPSLVLLAAMVAPAAAGDKMVFGIELGAPFRVPACDSRDGVVHSARLCFDGAAVTRKAWGAAQYDVSLPNAQTPPYVRGALVAFVVDGIVESMWIETWGVQAQGGALSALTKKYGQPARARQERQNTLRSRFAVQFAEWDFADFSVKFDGSTGSIDWGRIEVSMHRYRKRVEEYQKR